MNVIAGFDSVLDTQTEFRSIYSDGHIDNKNLPARMAFPGCVTFLPPTAAAARFLLAEYDRC